MSLSNQNADSACISNGRLVDIMQIRLVDGVMQISGTCLHLISSMLLAQLCCSQTAHK